MNELHTNVCFDALSILNNVQIVENVCNICGAQHYTGNCPDYSKAINHVLDTPQQNLSRSSIPNGLIIVDNENGTCVVTSQKFAKGTRFGPLLAPKSYIPIDNLSFPLVLFSNPIQEDDFEEIQELFNVRNVYLNTSDENNCNWMIHVNVAEYSNEQNLICYQENNQIYYSANQDIELGDILKVWYSHKYASQLNIRKMLEPSQFVICNNILRQVSTEYGIDIDNNNDFKFNENNNNPDNRINSEISLPPINSIMKSSPLCAVDKTYFSASLSSDDILHNLSMTSNDLNLSFESNYAVYNDEIQTNDKMINYETSFDSYISSSTPIHPTSSSNLKDTIDINKFACEICNRKYVSTANLDKHMRQHNLFMCVTCMKIFEQPDEFKEHDCFKQKASLKNSLHCPICLKVLSNSWSLQRHMKIHKGEESEGTINLSDDNESINKTAEESNAPERFDKTDNEIDITVIQKPLELIDSSTSTSTSKAKSTVTHSCIVCSKIFKNITSLDNHLKKIHTVYILQSTTATKNRHYESASKKLNNNNNKKAPIKPSIAKALANKLTEKNKKKMKSTEDNKSTTLTSNSVGRSSFDNSQPSSSINQKKKLIVVSNFEQNTNDNIPKLVPILSSSSPMNTQLTNALNDTISNSEKLSGPPFLSESPNDNKIIIHNKTAAVNKYVKNMDETANRGSFRCEQCGKMFEKKYHLTRHQVIHENIYYNCPYCNRQPLKAKSSLRKHLMNNHINEKDEWNEKNFINNLITNNQQFNNLVLKSKMKFTKNNNNNKHNNKNHLMVLHNESTKTSQFSQNSSSSLSFESLSVDFNQNRNNTNLSNSNLTFQNMFLENINSTNLSTCNGTTHNNNNNNINLNLFKHCDSKKQTKIIRNNNNVMPKIKRSKIDNNNLDISNNASNNTNNLNNNTTLINNNSLTLDNFFDDDVNNIVLYDHQLNTHAIRNPTITTNSGHNNTLEDIITDGSYSSIHNYDYVNDEKLKNSFDEIQNKLNSDDYLNNDDNYHHHQINWNELDDDGDDIDDKSDVVNTNKLLNIEDNLMLI